MGPKVSSILAMVSILVLLFGEPSLWLGSHPYPGSKKTSCTGDCSQSANPLPGPRISYKGVSATLHKSETIYPGL